ncbi:MAG: aspartyl-tRNA(Asn)/glutamyl-tRNA (Gln) amidotransferase subunit C [Microgenomates group bacterium Gr01-1014_80]|nr:MAG: aspartyl-tRNA(Asn)/glutamyl-tRNA (Gln) amidotransferase subunit C [Microgenomates group bacterium Gr01-1014_80]
MKLTKDQVKHVAKLANLPLSSDEEEKYAEQLSKILDYIDQLNSLSTQDVEPTYNVSGLSSVTRPDEVGKSLTQDEVLQNAPNKKNSFFVTKGIFSDE